jgi:hypothetical protein
MNYRTTALQALKSYAVDFTELIDINLSDVISRIRIGFEALQATSSTGSTAHWAKGIKKIELTDGSDVLFSLDGEELYGAQFFQNKVPNSDWLQYLAGNYSHISLILDFGRYLWDPMLALDPRKFKNLQLKVESQFAYGGSVPTAAKMEVYASVFDEKAISPIGFLSTKRIKQYTMAASSHEYTDLPMDLRIRKILVRALVPGTELCQTLANIKISEDNDKKVIVDAPPDKIIRLYPEENRQYIENMDGQNDGSERIYHSTISDRGAAMVTNWAAALATYGGTYGIVGQQFGLTMSGGGNWQAFCHGYCPMSMVSIPMGDEKEIDDWFDPSGLKNLRADILTCAAGASPYLANVITQQFRPY